MINRLPELAADYHRALPDAIRQYLNGRGISDVSVDFHMLGWNGKRITIPIFDRCGKLVFFKLARGPEDKSPPKMRIWPKGHLELYGWEEINAKPEQIIICEGEFDRLVLEGRGFQAVTSTAGAGTFRKEWVPYFLRIPEVYICFDNDQAGRKGAFRIGSMLAHARIVSLPGEIGEGGDVTDFFNRLGKERRDFLNLLEEAKPVPAIATPMRRPTERRLAPDFPLKARIDFIKAHVSIGRIVGRYVELRPSGNRLTGLCPFHDDHFPSLTVYPESNSYYCFGCHKHGDAIDFLMEAAGLSFRQAIELLFNESLKEN